MTKRKSIAQPQRTIAYDEVDPSAGQAAVTFRLLRGDVSESAYQIVMRRR